MNHTVATNSSVRQPMKDKHEAKDVASSHHHPLGACGQYCGAAVVWRLPLRGPPLNRSVRRPEHDCRASHSINARCHPHAAQGGSAWPRLLSSLPPCGRWESARHGSLSRFWTVLPHDGIRGGQAAQHTRQAAGTKPVPLRPAGKAHPKNHTTGTG